MLSRVALRSGALARVQPQVCALISVRGTSTDKTVVTKQTDIQKANALFNSPDRDFKNFPPMKMPETCPPVRYAWIPESFFQAFYNKTGVTGPYLFGAGLVTFLLSKEIWVVDHGFTEFFSFWAAVWIVNRKVGKPMAEYLDKKMEERHEKIYYKPIQDAKRGYLALIKNAEEDIASQDAQKMLFESKRENVQLQLEATYRQRLAEVHNAVKKRLDYQLDVQQAKRRFEQDHMVNWIIDNVVKSISPKQEKESVSKCIADLKALSAAS